MVRVEASKETQPQTENKMDMETIIFEVIPALLILAVCGVVLGFLAFFVSAPFLS